MARLAVGALGLLGFWTSMLTLLAIDSDMRTRVNERLPPERRFPLPGPGWRRDHRAERRQLRYSYGVLFPEGTLLQRWRLVQVLLVLCGLTVAGCLFLPWE
jgi:hypothetical protein